MISSLDVSSSYWGHWVTKCNISLISKITFVLIKYNLFCQHFRFYFDTFHWQMSTAALRSRWGLFLWCVQFSTSSLIFSPVFMRKSFATIIYLSSICGRKTISGYFLHLCETEFLSIIQETNLNLLATAS